MLRSDKYLQSYVSLNIVQSGLSENRKSLIIYYSLTYWGKILDYDIKEKNSQKHNLIHMFLPRNSIFTLFSMIRSLNFVLTLVSIF